MSRAWAKKRAWVCLVLNPRAGSLLDQDADALFARLTAHLDARGIAVEGGLVEGGKVNNLVREAASRDDPPLAVIVGGGDGTVIAAAEPLVGRGIPLGILPLGTLNLMARDLLLPLEPTAALDAMVTGLVGRVDLARVNGYPFLNLAVLGVKSSITRFREKRRGKLDPWQWARVLWHAAKVYRRTPRSRLTLRAPGWERRVRVHALGVSNNPYNDTPGPALSRDRMNAGTLGIYIAKHRGGLGLLRQLFGLLVGRWKSDPQVEVHERRELTIHSRRKRLHLTVDGEPLSRATPLVFTLEPGALSVLAAAEAGARIREPAPSPLGQIGAGEGAA